jgi:transcriptional regulator with XRE-family HTH domain
MSSEWTPQKDGKVSLASHRLEALRGYLGKISQQQLANRTGLSRRTIQDWENQGKTTVKTYTAFLNQLGVTDLRQFDKHYEDFHRPFSEIVRKGLPLVLPSREWNPDWMPPGALLRAESGIVRFHQRQRELAELTEWCCSSSGLQVQLCHAPGGMGKTRLAIELCRQMREKEKWQAGFLDTAAFREDEELWQGVLTSGGRLLLVLDYAESCSGILQWVFSQVTAIRGAHVRILLLTRKVGDWLEQLKSATPARELLTGPAFSQRRLASVTVDPSERLSSWQMAHEDLAKALGIPASGKPPSDLSEQHFERILLLQMSALAVLENVQVKGEDGLLDYILNRERNFWKQQLRANEMSEGLATGLGQALAGVTLNMGAETEEDGMKVLSALPFFQGQPQQVLHALNRILADSYPGNHWIEPVQPDLLGERLSEVSLDDPEVRGVLFGLFRRAQVQQGGGDVSR